MHIPNNTIYYIEEYNPSTPSAPELEGDVNHDGVVLCGNACCGL